MAPSRIGVTISSSGRQHSEGDVEAHLVVAGAGGAVGDRRRPDRTRHVHHGQRLLRPLGGDAQRVHLAAQDVALDQVAHEAVEDLRAGADLMVLDRADPLRLPTDGRALLAGRAAGIDVDGVHRPAVVGEPGNAVGSVEPAGECEGDRAWLHIA